MRGVGWGVWALRAAGRPFRTRVQAAAASVHAGGSQGGTGQRKRRAGGRWGQGVAGGLWRWPYTPGWLEGPVPQ